MTVKNFQSPQWSKEEYDRLEHLYAQTDTPIGEIARIMGRSKKAIHNKRDMCGLPSRLELKRLDKSGRMNEQS